MSVTYVATVIPAGNHASLPIPDEILEALGASRRAPLKVTINGHTYRSTATAVGGECRVVFPSADRIAAGAQGGDQVTIHLQLDSGYREVELHPQFEQALQQLDLRKDFDALSYSKRKEFARSVNEAKAEETRLRRIEKAIADLSTHRR